MLQLERDIVNKVLYVSYSIAINYSVGLKKCQGKEIHGCVEDAGNNFARLAAMASIIFK